VSKWYTKPEKWKKHGESRMNALKPFQLGPLQKFPLLFMAFVLCLFPSVIFAQEAAVETPTSQIIESDTAGEDEDEGEDEESVKLI
jgi:hypothetical protein